MLREEGRRAAALAIALVCVGIAACATPPPQAVEGRYLSRAGTVSVADPGAEWRPVVVDGATLALQGPDGAAMTWIHRCRERLPPVRLLARDLLAGLELVEWIENEAFDWPAADASVEGWRLHARARDEAATVRVVGRVRRGSRCHDDFAWVGPERLSAAPDAFHRLWRSLDPAREQP